MEGTEQSPIMEARAMRLFPTVVWRAEIRPHACRRINEAIVAKLAALSANVSETPIPPRNYCRAVEVRTDEIRKRVDDQDGDGRSGPGG